MPMTLAELLALLPDNTTGAIGADDMRTVTTELYTQGVVAPPVTSVDGETGAVNLTDNYTRLWDVTAVQAGNYTAQPNELVLFDTTAAARTLTLPAAPPNGTQCGARIVTFGTGNYVTVTCSGADVLDKPGGPASATNALQYNNMALTLVYDSGVWTRAAGLLPLTASDARYLQAATTPTLAAGQDLELSAVVANVQTVQTTTLAHAFLTPLYLPPLAADGPIVSNSIAMVDDPAFALTLAANATTYVEFHVIYEAGASTEFRLQFGGPAGATFANWECIAVSTAATVANGAILRGAGLTLGTFATAGGIGIGSLLIATCSGLAVTGAAGGSFYFRYCQSTATVENTVRKAGSWARGHRLA